MVGGGGVNSCLMNCAIEERESAVILQFHAAESCMMCGVLNCDC